MPVSFSSRTPNEGLAPCPAQMWEEEALREGWEMYGSCQGTGTAIPAGRTDKLPTPPCFLSPADQACSSSHRQSPGTGGWGGQGDTQ